MRQALNLNLFIIAACMQVRGLVLDAACMQVRGQVPEQEVRHFWEERYCAGLMRLVVVGPQPLHELEALVRARFGAVRNLGAVVPAFPGVRLTAWRASGSVVSKVSFAAAAAAPPPPLPHPFVSWCRAAPECGWPWRVTRVDCFPARAPEPGCILPLADFAVPCLATRVSVILRDAFC